MQSKASTQISSQTFVQSILILFYLMIVTGILTQVIPVGSYTRLEVDGREMFDPGSFHYVQVP